MSTQKSESLDESTGSKDIKKQLSLNDQNEDSSSSAKLKKVSCDLTLENDADFYINRNFTQNEFFDLLIPTSGKDNERRDISIIGICGGTAAGKSLISHIFQNFLQKLGYIVAIVKERDFYKRNKKFREPSIEDDFSFNYDHPDAINWEKFNSTIKKIIDDNFKIKNQEKIQEKSPQKGLQQNLNDQIQENQKIDSNLSEKTSITEKSAQEKSTSDKSAQEKQNFEKQGKKKKIPQKIDVLLVEGTMIFGNETLRNQFNLKIFMDTDDDIRLSRRVYKHTQIKKQDLLQVIQYYQTYTKPGFEKYTFPFKKCADIIIPNFGEGYSVLKDFQEDEELSGYFQIQRQILDLIVRYIIDEQKPSGNPTVNFEENENELLQTIKQSEEIK